MCIVCVTLVEFRIDNFERLERRAQLFGNVLRNFVFVLTVQYFVSQVNDFSHSLLSKSSRMFSILLYSYHRLERELEREKRKKRRERAFSIPNYMSVICLCKIRSFSSNRCI